MQIITVQLPSKFVKLHEQSIGAGAERMLAGDRWRVMPREPLGSVSLDGPPVNESVTVVELVGHRKGRDLYVGPANEASRIVAAQWAERHRDTTEGEFDWCPFVASDAA